jgi:hypothetical protein
MNSSMARHGGMPGLSDALPDIKYDHLVGIPCANFARTGRLPQVIAMN